MCGRRDEMNTFTPERTPTMAYDLRSRNLDATFFRPRCLLYKYIFGSEEFGLGIQAFCLLVRSPMKCRSASVKKYRRHKLYS